MEGNEIKVGQYYWYTPAYGKDRQIYKCREIRFNDAQNQWVGKFEIITDTSHSNSIGVKKNMNEIEMERYIHEIRSIESAIRSFESHQISNELTAQNKE